MALAAGVVALAPRLVAVGRRGVVALERGGLVALEHGGFLALGVNCGRTRAR